MAKKASEKFQPFHDEYVDLAATLEQLCWAKDWNIQAMMFGGPKVRGASIRMWKKIWPEELHFESWIGNADIDDDPDALVAKANSRR